MVKRARLTAEETKRIVEAVRAAERGHRGEIVVHFVDRCRGDALEDAAKVFATLARTRHDTAVVLLVASVDRKVGVFAGTGVYGRERPDFWKAVTDVVAARAASGDVVGGVVDAVAKLGQLLSTAAPGADDAGDELPALAEP